MVHLLVYLALLLTPAGPGIPVPSLPPPSGGGLPPITGPGGCSTSNTVHNTVHSNSCPLT
jgi:hypothetical protein